MRRRIGALLAALIAAVLALLVGPLPSSVVDVAPTAAANYAYDTHHTQAQLPQPASERGPPAWYDRGTTYGAVDRWSHGASAHPSGTTPPETYDHSSPLVPVAGMSRTTAEAAEGVSLDLVRSTRLRVAAKAEAGAVRACEGGLCGIPGKTCFVAGTLIRTERGDIPIEEVKVGDKVWSRNIDTGKDELQPVVQTYVRHADTLLKLTVAGAVLTTTADHPFMVKDRGWVKAGDLTVGDVLVTPTGTAALVGVEWVAKGATVYNFQVAVNHDYYALAGVTPILVHNANYDLGELLTSGHGAQRLAERGFDDIDIAIVRSSSTVYEQADGAVAHVARLGDTYNVVVVGERGIVTGMKGVTEQGLGNLARNYGWTGFP